MNNLQRLLGRAALLVLALGCTTKPTAQVSVKNNVFCHPAARACGVGSAGRTVG